MAKNWIKKAIKHPGRCTPGSPNYDCPKGSPQWNLAQRFKHGDLHKKEYGGMAASDNVDMGYYSNPLKYFAAMGINISDDDCLECGGKIKAEDGLNPKPLIPPKPEQIDFEMERQLPPDASYERDVRKFSWNNRDTDPEQIKLDSSYMLYKKPKGYSNVYNKGKLIGYTIDNKILIPGEPNFQNGGIVKAWIQKFSNGGYIADGGFPAGQELTQPTTNYYNWGNYGNQNSFLTPNQINQKPFQNTVPLANTNMPQNMGTNYFTPYDASNDQVNKDNQLASSMMSKSTKTPNPADAILGGVNMAGDIATGAIGAFAKPDSKASAYAQGSAKAQSVVKPLEKIPILGQASKLISGIIGGALEARRKGIENEEMDKYNKLQEYTSRNTQTAQQPSYYGQYMSKYGSNIKNLEQRLVDDIFSDYDKFMKLT